MSNLKNILIIFSFLPLIGFTQSKAQVLFFIYEKCPICINYTRTINKIKSEYKNQIKLIGVFPNQLSNEESISQFTSKFELEFDEIIIDSNLNYVNKYEAIITPQVFLLDSCQSVFYQGRIDNQYISVGKRNKKITSNELEDAIFAMLNNKEIAIKETQPVGCFITK